MSNPTITIGVTTYNAEATIVAALESALIQTLPASQIIVVDDASTDRTLQVVATYSKDDSRFLVLQNAVNSGVAVSRNRIVEHAIGDFIAFFDDDDISDPRRLELQLERILSYERQYAIGAPVLCHTAREQWFPDGRVQIEPAMGHHATGPAPAGIAVARHALMGEPIEGGYGACATCSQMGRTTTYQQLGGFMESLHRCEDFELVLRLAKAGGHFPGIADPLVRQEMTPTSEKNLYTLERFNLLAMTAHRDVFDSEAQFNACCHWIRFKYSLMAGDNLKTLRRLIRATSENPAHVVLRLMRAVPNLRGTIRFATFIRKAIA
jgi:glycosyltransferase involved in cell wall biosynthesis